jgi:hypothetical protein
MLRPQMHLIAAGRLYPKAWCQADQFRADRGKGTLPTWPSWCYLPMAAWYAIVSGGKGRLGLDRIGHVGQLAALGSWRVIEEIIPEIAPLLSLCPIYAARRSIMAKAPDPRTPTL